jgi:hypothetical protein
VGKPNEHAVSDERDIAEDGEDAQIAHVLGHERQEHHRRGDVPGEIGYCHHGPGPLLQLVLTGCGSGDKREPAPDKCRERVPKKFQNVSELRSNRAMVAIRTFGPFRLDASARILFRGSEPVPLGRRAVALLHALVVRQGVPLSKDVLIEAAWSRHALCGAQPGLMVRGVRPPLLVIAQLGKRVASDKGGSTS